MVTSKLTKRPLCLKWPGEVMYNYDPSENTNYSMKLNISSTMTGTAR